MHNIYSNLALVSLLAPIAVTATGASLVLDRLGYETAAVVLLVGALTGTHDADNNLVFALEESDTIVANDFTAVAAGDIVSSTLPTLDSAGEAGKAYYAEYKGAKRYLRVKYTEEGTASMIMAVLGLLGEPREAPVPSPAVGTTAT